MNFTLHIKYTTYYKIYDYYYPSKPILLLAGKQVTNLAKELKAMQKRLVNKKQNKARNIS